MRIAPGGLGLALSLAALAAPATAQIDYRNLDDDRPVRVEDAYPTERYAFELLRPYRVEREQGGGTVHAFPLELEYGAIRNGHVGIKAPLAILREGGRTTTALAGLRVFAMYNVNTESRALPAVSLRADATLPVGGLGGSEAHLALKAIATRSIGRNRIHLNASWRTGPDGQPAAVDAAERWWVGLALDRTLYRQSVLLVAEGYAAKLARGARVEVAASLGLRWQWRPTTVLDFGISRRLRSGVGPDYALTVGTSMAFALSGLMPGSK